MNRKALVAAGAGLALLTPLAPAAASAVQGQDAKPTARSQDGPSAQAISRATVIKRAKTWLTANNGSQVPYSQSKTFQGYRTDCSGYASMALKYGKPGTNTVGLATSDFTSKIKMANLKKGDLVIDAKGSNTTRHVVIFEKWTSSAKNKYWAYEQRGGHGTDHRKLTYGLGSDEFDAYRPKKY
ncbi:hypothetical protein [Streptomyces sp. NPDC005438]|uniref:hypothetical protein n=1 Tax=Streptomyces sp. NPDC005438 TaxID=3156880 RepID=UPI0033AF84CB